MNEYPPAVHADERAEPGSRVEGIFGVEGLYRAYTLDHWIAVDEYTAIGYASVEGLPVPVGLVHYAPISATAVREWKVGEMIRPEPWMPRFDQRHPPLPHEIRRQWWKATGRVGEWKVVFRNPEDPPPAPALARKEGQDPDEFYAEVAHFYRAFQATTSKPTTSIAHIAGVSRNRAAQWVHQARKRGHLEPADKGE